MNPELPWGDTTWQEDLNMTPIEKLRRLAEEADAKARYYEGLNAASGLDREHFIARQQYFNGQASGFRHAIWLLEMEG